MNVLERILKNKDGEKRYLFVFLFFIVTFGIVFSNFNQFMEPELKSKRFWLYITVPACGLLFLFVRRKKTLRFEASGFILIILFFYCFLRTVDCSYKFGMAATNDRR